MSIPHNSTLTNIIPHTPVLIPRFSIFNSTLCSVELCGKKLYSTQPIAYSTQKKIYSTYLVLIPHVIPRLERGIKYRWFYSTLVFLFHAGQFYSTQFHAKCDIRWNYLLSWAAMTTWLVVLELLHILARHKVCSFYST